MSDRLPNGLTPEQDAALDALAVALAEHLLTHRPTPTTDPNGESHE